MTVLETIQRSTEFLAKKGVDSPRLHAELLLAHVLKLPRMRLYLDFERALNPSEVEAIREMIRRRGRREPLQHIVGSTSFCGLEMLVNGHVLVPRPETELLAELGWGFLNALAARGSETGPERGRAPAALDYGTGSGCLAVALAVKCPEAQVHAVDISAEGLEIARRNAAAHSVVDRIHFWQGDGLAALPSETRFDLIASNPPYIPSAEIAGLAPEVRDFDPRQALDGGPDGLDHYRGLAAQAGTFLRPGGKVMLEFGDGQSDSIRRLLEDQKWAIDQIVEDYTHRPRMLVASSPAELDPAARG